MRLTYRYLLFCFDRYYPLGGMNDCQRSFSDEEMASKYFFSSDYDYAHLFDKLEGRVVARYKKRGLE